MIDVVSYFIRKRPCRRVRTGKAADQRLKKDKTMRLKTILMPFAIFASLLGGSPAFARVIPHHEAQDWFPNAFDDAQPKANEPPPQVDFCVSPPIEYEPTTEPPPGCPGDMGPYR